jgi:flagellar basal body-associated protein FliL
MSDKKEEAKPEAEKVEGGKKGGSTMVLVGVVLSAVLAGGAAYGGARAAAKPTDHPEPEKPKYQPPGPTVDLEPFIANIPDSEGKPHAIKMTIVIELGREAKAEEFKVFIPRVRDITLGYLRSQSFDRIVDQENTDVLRKELLAKWHGVGATDATQVLITDLITQ